MFCTDEAATESWRTTSAFSSFWISRRRRRSSIFCCRVKPRLSRTVLRSRMSSTFCTYCSFWLSSCSLLSRSAVICCCSCATLPTDASSWRCRLCMLDLSTSCDVSDCFSVRFSFCSIVTVLPIDCSSALNRFASSACVLCVHFCDSSVLSSSCLPAATSASRPRFTSSSHLLRSCICASSAGACRRRCSSSSCRSFSRPSSPRRPASTSFSRFSWSSPVRSSTDCSRESSSRSRRSSATFFAPSVSARFSRISCSFSATMRCSVCDRPGACAACCCSSPVVRLSASFSDDSTSTSCRRAASSCSFAADGCDGCDGCAGCADVHCLSTYGAMDGEGTGEAAACDGRTGVDTCCDDSCSGGCCCCCCC
eukprot:Rhum_TRINITY_DN14487_c1_g1::Rhum_TRINITY_DN14487_c1_g1_i1::g.90512::m.90512